MPNPWVILGLVLAWLASMAAVGAWQHKAGVTSEHDQWETREAKINSDAAVLIKAADDKVRDAEHVAAANISAIDADYQLKLKGKDDALAIALNTVRAGGKLFTHSTCPAPAGNAANQTTTSTGSGNGQARCQFSDADSDFLLRLGSEADKVADQLTSAQAVILADRKTCNGN